jgi:hypothetical protein
VLPIGGRLSMRAATTADVTRFRSKLRYIPPQPKPAAAVAKDDTDDEPPSNSTNIFIVFPEPGASSSEIKALCQDYGQIVMHRPGRSSYPWGLVQFKTPAQAAAVCVFCGRATTPTL